MQQQRQRRHVGAAAAALAMAAALSLVGYASAQCVDLRQKVALGTYYYISSPDYPNNYSGALCYRWHATTSNDNRLNLTCNPFNLPTSSNCQMDRFIISLSGDDTLSDAHFYCGQGAFALESVGTKLTMELQTSPTTPGGSFRCNITAIPASNVSAGSAPGCMCGMKKQSRIVGGVETGVNEFPFMAGLIDVLTGELLCGSTIVSAHYVATSAQCVVGRAVKWLAVLVGVHNIRKGADTPRAKPYRVSSFVAHPEYNQDANVTQDNNIALVRVVGTIAMSREVMPACLPIRYANQTFSYARVEVVGWGTTQFGGNKPDKLMKADLYVQTPEVCTREYGNTVSIRQMCTYSARKDACQDDSGGPLFWQDLNSGYTFLVGIVSLDYTCASDLPGVNTRVTYYLNWITGIIGAEDQYCIV